MSMKCLSGEDKDMEVRYTTTSVGGKKAVQALAIAIATQVETDSSKPVPIVVLNKEHYSHKSYGRIYTPVFDVQSWVGMDADKAEQLEAPKEAEAEASAPTTRRRRG